MPCCCLAAELTQGKELSGDEDVGLQGKWLVVCLNGVGQWCFRGQRRLLVVVEEGAGKGRQPSLEPAIERTGDGEKRRNLDRYFRTVLDSTSHQKSVRWQLAFLVL